MVSKKKQAGLTATVIMLAAASLAGQPAQAYGPVANSLGCRLYFTDTGTGISPTTWNDTFGLTLSPAQPSPGQTVTVTLTATGGPMNGPSPLLGGDVPVVVQVALGGSASGTVTLNQANYPASGKDPYTQLGPITASGTFVAGAAGASTATVRLVKFANSQASTYCSDAGDRDHKASPEPTTIVENFTVFDGATTITSVTGQTVSTHARAGNTINFAVTGLAPNASLTATLKDSAGAGTGEGSGSGSTTAAGSGTGTLVVPASPTPGSRTLVVSDGVNTVSKSVTILGAPTVSINPGGGGSGTTVAVTGTNWNPGSSVTVGGYKPLAGPPPPASTSDTQVTVTASASGGISGSFTVTDPTTAFVGASSGFGQGTLFAIAGWTVSPDVCVGPCALSYNVTQVVTGGNLAMVRTAGSSNISLTGVTLNGSAQESSGTLSALTVTDYRGTTFGWSLVATLSDFTGTPGGTISKANLFWSPLCVSTPGAINAVTAVAGSAGPVDAATLCSAPADPAGTGGSFDASAALALTVPANQLAGNYTATLTLTLS